MELVIGNLNGFRVMVIMVAVIFSNVLPCMNGQGDPHLGITVAPPPPSIDEAKTKQYGPGLASSITPERSTSGFAPPSTDVTSKGGFHRRPESPSNKWLQSGFP